jgi:hypothetical protein
MLPSQYKFLYKKIVVTGPPRFLDTPIAASYDVVNKAKESAFKRRAIWLMTPGIGFFRA